MVVPPPPSSQRDPAAAPNRNGRRPGLLNQLGHPAWQGVAALVALAGLVLALFLALDPFEAGSADGAGEAPPPQPGTAEEPRPIVDKTGYLLRRSSFVDTNDQDKVDVDTGCPGWGGMHPRIGPSRCGELADVILDEEGLHTAEGRPSLVYLPPGRDGGYESCRAAFEKRPDPSVIEVGVGELEAGGGLCIETDQGNLAAVRIDEISVDGTGQLESMMISFRVWPPPTES